MKTIMKVKISDRKNVRLPFLFDYNQKNQEYFEKDSKQRRV